MKRFGITVCALALTGTAQAQDLQTLIDGAKGEPPTTVLAVTGKIVDQAEAFSAKYGLNVTGRKVNEAAQADLLIREHEAGNIQTSVSLAADAAVIGADLLDRGIVQSWAPEDIDLPDAARDPLVVVTDPHVWAYNSAAYDACPVANVWELTTPEWQRRVAIMDPLDKPNYADWFNQLETSHDAAMADAYRAQFGTAFDGESATAAWVEAFAANAPLVADSTGVAEAVGAAQDAPFFGMVSVAKFRDEGLDLAICDGIAPFAGWLYPGLGVIASGTPSPNTAKLFIHYLLTEEGIALQAKDGKIPADPAIGLPADEPSGLTDRLPQMMVWNTASAASDLERRQDWQDLWQINIAGH